ncbi:MAG: Fe-S cluster assembly protein HesB [Geodermatophilaceae bacterium]|nr:Fe-S cluster assembly protein HesB [Geodermatophilaceae bacterium]
MPVTLSQNSEADALLDRDPLALLIGMVLDQQIPLEKAFSSPLELTKRLGHELDVRELADYDSDALAAIFAQRPALHRFPTSMAGRVQGLARVLVADYDGDVNQLWAGVADGEELLARITALPGFGGQKAAIYLALLGKQRGIRPTGWREAAGEFGEDGVYLSVADIVDADSLLRVRDHKQQQKAAAKTDARTTVTSTAT